MRSLPAAWYCDPAVYEAERKAIFARTWQFIGPEAEFARAGDYRAVQIAGYRLFVIRERSGALRQLWGLPSNHESSPSNGEPVHDNALATT